MDEFKKKAIQKLTHRMIRELDINSVINELKAKDILSIDHVDELKNIIVESERRQKLLQIIINVDNSWDPFLKALDGAKQHNLRIQLECEAYATPIAPYIESFIPQLERYIKKEAEHIRKFWKEYLESVELKDIYQPLEIVEIRGQNLETEIDEGYDFIWENPSRTVFLIDGDPGIGKTTWLNKLATDWTNKNESIRKNFSLLLLVPLRYLISPTFDGLLEYLSCIFHKQIDVRMLENCLLESTTLLLLDGFDENPSCIDFISKLNVKNGYYCTILITSRGSHSHEIRAICDKRLMVKGFKEEAICRFFELQNCEQSKAFNSYSQLPEMCKVPMIAAILCSIYKHNDVSEEIGKDDNCALLIIFDNFLKMLINMASEKRSNEFNKTKDEKKVMEAAGKFALATVKRE